MRGGPMRRRRTIAAGFGFAGVLAFGSAGLSTCSSGVIPTNLPTTTTTVKPTTTTTTTVPLPDPAQEMISVDPNGAPAQYPLGGGSSGLVSMSADGRYVAFEANATNLVPGDTNGLYDVYVRDRVTRTTTRVDLKSDGSQITTADIPATSQLTAAADAIISANGRYVSFGTTAQLLPNDTDHGW